jgi:glycosyltransferase involved in cell wall biosynthesis
MTSRQRRLSLLHLVNLFPYPPRSGYDLRVWQICRHLARKADVTVLCRVFKPLSEDMRRVGEESGIHFNCLVLPRPRVIQKARKGIRFLFSPYPIMSAGWFFPEMRRALRSNIQAKPDVVVIDGAWSALYWPQLKSFRGLKVINAHNLETDRLRREAAVMKPGLKQLLLLNDARRMSAIERGVFASADLVWVTSRVDLDKVHRLCPDAKVEVAPNGVDSSSIKVLPASSGAEILFVGSLDYFPNIDAVRFFANEVMPLILARQPDAVFKVVGHNPRAEILELHAPPHVVITGEADSLEPIYAHAAVCVVPLRAGGGTRLKILEAMAYGRPVVSTTLGAEGLDVENGKHLLLADGPNAIAQALYRLLSGAENTSELICRARELVEKYHDWRQIAQNICLRYGDLLAKRQPPRIRVLRNDQKAISSRQP